MLNLDTSPRKYFPSVYDGVLEIDELANAENGVFVDALSELNSLWRNSFIAKCDEVGIAQYEKVLGIIPDLTLEDLEFRKNRVLNRFAMIPAFTMPWLRARLDELLGAGNWVYSIDFGKRELVVETIESSSIWLHEVSVTINHVKPANLVFISRPLQALTILVNEEVSKSVRTDNYLLGTWKLGNLPFANLSSEEVVKMADTPSIQQSLLTQLAEFTADDIKSVLVNDKHRITTFIDKSNNGSLAVIEYEVFANAGLDTITNVKLLDALDRPLVNMALDIDNTFNVRMRHQIHIREGINAEATRYTVKR